MSLKAAGSSVDKGESLQDTILTLTQYEPAAIVIRHPQIGAPHLVARWSEAAVVNAGDGKHQHPTQALLDLHAMREALGRLDGVHVAIVGDVLHSRVARSLIQALALAARIRRWWARRRSCRAGSRRSARPRPSSAPSPTPTSSTCSASSASGWSPPSCRACASTPRAGESPSASIRGRW